MHAEGKIKGLSKYSEKNFIGEAYTCQSFHFSKCSVESSRNCSSTIASFPRINCRSFLHSMQSVTNKYSVHILNVIGEAS